MWASHPTEGLLRKSFTPSKRFHRTPPPSATVPLVLSGPLCPAGISPPRGESPHPVAFDFSRTGHLPTPWGVTPKGEAIFHSGSPLLFRLPFRGAGSRRLTEGFLRKSETLCKRSQQYPSTSFAGPPPFSREALPTPQNRKTAPRCRSAVFPSYYSTQSLKRYVFSK